MSHTYSKSYSVFSRLLLAASFSLLSLTQISCSDSSTGQPANTASPPPASKTDTSREAEQIVEKSRALDSSRGSVSNLKARIVEADGSSRTVQLRIYRKRQEDGRQIMLIEFTAPPEERDRDALIAVSPQGEIEATRYVQSSNSFVTTTSVLGEDSLFGMTLQELADGQTEKYDYRLIGEETFESKPVYRIEGSLKQGIESKFPRIVLLISKENNAVIVAEFYDSGGALTRRVTVDRFQEVGDYLARMRWTIDNQARKKRIEFETVGAKYDVNISNAIFSRERLKKISTK
ncbi:MAG TPA: outer membrane lipoprotein-sorting protein [Blastocatellia bacterium]|nr:outer membrane lipoprotein-sorting protein [Blastocatellia bacterium]